MRLEYYICQHCPIGEDSCDERLVPYNGFRNGERRIIHPDLLTLQAELCWNFTCDYDGLAAAEEAMQHPELAKEYQVSMAEGRLELRLAVPFGTGTKPTEEGELRIVDLWGQIFAKGEDGMYYPTQWI